MIVNGETYACEACVRGHRARSCDHHGRPLQPIRKKGRPASQCGHCRSMRKSRSAHVKCDCGKRAREGETETASPHGGKPKCNCFEDGICICAVKHEQLTQVTVPQAVSDDGASPSVPSVAGSACCGAPDSLPSSSLPAIEEPGDFDNHAWQNHGLFQLDQEHAHHAFNDPGTGWNASLAHPQSWGSYTYHELQMAQPPLGLSNVDGLGHSNPMPFDDFPGTTQDMLDAGLVATTVNWAPGEPSLPSGHDHDQIVSGAELMWFEGMDQSTIPASTSREHVAAESVTAAGHLTRPAAPE
ncbi:Copper resistance protein CRF1 [Tolypocladium capitatum]|uniref:Copper resistance protein CRF1 n=1 Tax=Tolypocladium capitatum TaxID=45235 RepID=A0A2K3QLA0_9HYPO|nr:Copper resistance protein CRF1 [Tolypocladium capitatum]